MEQLEVTDLLSHALSYGYVDGEGKVWTKDSDWKKGRVIGALQDESEEERLTYYAQKYVELSKGVNEIVQECQERDDYTTYLSKVASLREEAERGNSLGDHQMLFDQLSVLLKNIYKQQEGNTEKKKELVKKAEELRHSKDWKVSSTVLQELTHTWNAIGEADKSERKDLDKRFNRAKKGFFDSRKEFFNDLTAEKELNELLKDTIVRKAQRLQISTDWKEASDIQQLLMEEWKELGMVTTPEKSQELWEKFLAAREVFFERRKKHYEELDEERAANLEKKKLVIAKAKEISQTDDWKTMARAFDQLFEIWRGIGPVDKEHRESVWAEFKEAREHFYQRRKEYYKELDQQREANTALKKALVDKSKALEASEEWKETTQAFLQLMDEWKAIGPVTADQRESIWQDFIQPRENFFKRKEVFTKQVKEERQANIPIKQALIDQAKELSTSTKWKETHPKMLGLLDEWKKTGSLPNDVSESMWKEFNEARDIFFTNQRAHFDKKDKERQENLVLKEELCRRAEELSQSTRFKETHKELQGLRAEWKKIGFVPKEVGDAVWDRFNKAFDTFYDNQKAFFAKKDAQREQQNADWKDRMQLKVKRLEGDIQRIRKSMDGDKMRIQDFKDKIEDLDDSDMSKMFKIAHENNIKEVEQEIKDKFTKIESVKVNIKELLEKIKN